jgi:hypothetical protein
MVVKEIVFNLPFFTIVFYIKMMRAQDAANPAFCKISKTDTGRLQHGLLCRPVAEKRRKGRVGQRPFGFSSGFAKQRFCPGTNFFKLRSSCASSSRRMLLFSADISRARRACRLRNLTRSLGVSSLTASGTASITGKMIPLRILDFGLRIGFMDTK